jgi:hypothetical protein
MIGYGSSTQQYDFFAYNTAGKVWNGSAFVTSVDADYVSYRIAPTSQTGNRFSAPAPSGTASYELRKRAESLTLSRTVWEGNLDVTSPTPTPTVSGTGAILDGPMGGVADTLIGLFGGTATLKQVRKEFDKRTDQEVTKTPLTWPVKIYPPVAMKVDQWAGNQITEGDFKTGISRVALEKVNAPVPTVGMFLVYRGKEWRIKAVLPIPSGDEIAMYEMLAGY